MATMQRTDSILSVRFTRGEKIAGWIRDAQVPLSAIHEVEVVDHPMGALRGLRAPGLGLPGVRAIGTWRRPGERTLVCVRRGQPAVRIRLDGQQHDAWLIGADDAAEVAASLTRAA